MARMAAFHPERTLENVFSNPPYHAPGPEENEEQHGKWHPAKHENDAQELLQNRL
jgi:tRNA1(Val) A37 N6-methylase TrmN6